MSQTQDNALTAGAELIAEQAREVGARCRLPTGIEAVTTLERALAIAWCDVAMWKGANDTDERFEETLRLMQARIAAEMRAQRILRRGHKPDILKGH